MKIESESDFISFLKFDVPHIQIRPRIVCSDGFSVSIQASVFHYCSPRNNFGPYDRFEIGFPSSPVISWLNYAEGNVELEDATGLVYPQVPLHLIVDELKTKDNVELINDNFIYIPESMRHFSW